jgi:hypothetical protein
MKKGAMAVGLILGNSGDTIHISDEQTNRRQGAKKTILDFRFWILDFGLKFNPAKAGPSAIR